MRSLWLLLILVAIAFGCNSAATRSADESPAVKVARINKAEHLPESNKSIPEVHMQIGDGHRRERVALQNRMFPVVGSSSESVDASDPYASYRNADYRLVRVGTGEVGLEFGRNGRPEKTWVLWGAKDVKIEDAEPTDALGVKVLIWKQASENPGGTPGKEDFTVRIVVPSWNGDAWQGEESQSSVRFVKMVPANQPKPEKKNEPEALPARK